MKTRKPGSGRRKEKHRHEDKLNALIRNMDGQPLMDIVGELNSRGYLTLTGRPWSLSTLWSYGVSRGLIERKIQSTKKPSEFDGVRAILKTELNSEMKLKLITLLIESQPC